MQEKNQHVGPDASDASVPVTTVRSRLTTLLDRGIVLGLCALVLANLLSFVADRWWFAELFCHFQWQYFVMAIGVVVAASCRRQILPVAVALGFCGLHSAALEPYWNATSADSAVEESASRSLLHWNVYIRNPSHAELIRAIEQLDPDFVLLQEIGDEWDRSLQVLKTRYPHHKIQSDGAPFGIAFFSNEPLRSLRIVSRGELENYVVAETEQGVTIVGAHVMSPVGSKAAALRNRQLRKLAEVVDETRGPILLAGDFNVTPWSPVFRELLAETNLRDARREFGLLTSWPNWCALFDVPIDHILPSEEIIVDRLSCPRLDCGSDHRPMLCRFRLATAD